MKSRQRGATTVEMAIIGALFFTVLFGVIEVGRALFAWNTLTEAARRGARVAAVCPLDHSAIARVAVFGDPASGTDSPVLSGLSTSNVSVQYLDASGNPTATFIDVRYVRVGITGYLHTLLIPFVGTTIPAPDFQTTLPRESLGVVPGVGSQCFGTP